MKKLILFAGISAVLWTLSLSSCSEGSDGENEKATTSNKMISREEWYQINLEKEAQKPKWLDTIPIIVAGGWDSDPATQRRWGRLAVNYLEEYEKRISEENVIKLKESGITLVITHFFKGFGIEGEGAYMENTKKFAELCHKHGLRVGVYIGNTICYEQLFLEKPEAKEWLVPDYLGRPVTYGGTQIFRKKPYIGHPGYQEYIKRVLKKAITEAKADLIHFDNSVQYGRPENFHHPLAIEQFRNYLREKYTPEQLQDRFDFTDVSYLIPPKYTSTPQPVQDPLFQEWTDFRCHKVGEYLLEMYNYIKELNPEVVVESNPHGEKGDNKAWTRGLDWPRVLAPTEISWCEGEGEPGLRENGVLVSRIRTYKINRTMNNMGFVQLGHDRLMMAESMAYNQNCLGYIGALLSHKYWDEETRKYVRFYHDHFPYYKNADNLAPVAIFRTFPTMAYSSYNTQYSTLLFEQTLIKTKIPFDIIFDQHLKEDVSKYKVLILANQDCLTDEQIEHLKSYVKAGGGLVITGNTSLYNDWRRRRHRLGLRDMFSEDLPYPPGTKISQHPWSLDSKWYRHSSWVHPLEGFTEEQKPQVRTQYGKGRVVYIPHVKPGLARRSGSPCTSQYWKLPDNYRIMEEAVKWAAGEPLPIEINAPLFVATECLWQKEENRMLVHLINYNAENQPVVKDINIRIALQEGKQVDNVTVFSPDSEVKKGILSHQTGDGWINFTVPDLHRYNLVAVKYEK